LKTLDEVEARIIVNGSNTPGDAANSFIITAPGSYYLVGNIVGARGKHGISIRANDVTLDLNGFALIGSGTGLCGVHVPNAQSGFYIHDGSVRGWTSGGVQAAAAVTLAEKLRLADNAGPAGLAVGNGSMVKDCVASSNIVGFWLPDRSQISDCIASVNLGDGFVCTSYVSIIDCTSSRNGGNGFAVEGGCSVIRCTATRNLPNGVGILAGPGCTIADCTVSNNGLDGISVDAGSTVRDCTVSANYRGIIAKNGSCNLIRNNCGHNESNGIEINDESEEGGAGGNRVDGNNCCWNKGYGFFIQARLRNLVIRNSAHRNGTLSQKLNYHLSNASAGPIVELGNIATITDLSPWANFSA
jgi:parallel beta-helix repeat protein